VVTSKGGQKTQGSAVAPGGATRFREELENIRFAWLMALGLWRFDLIQTAVESFSF
jgi:hypothetical protein